MGQSLTGCGQTLFCRPALIQVVSSRIHFRTLFGMTVLVNCACDKASKKILAGFWVKLRPSLLDEIRQSKGGGYVQKN
jgi:hypothetical protein